MAKRLDIQRAITDFPYYASQLLHIKTTRAQLIPLVLWEPQRRLHRLLEGMRRAGRLQRVVVLKARREGISTYAEARIFHASHMNENTESVIIAHEKESGDKIFSMCKLFYDCLPHQLRPMTKYHSKKEIVFENPDPKTRYKNPGLKSSIEVLTAGKKNVARGAGYHNLHASELGSWQFPQDVIPALVPTIPKTPQSLIVYESTAKGVGNFFHTEWLRAEAGESNFAPFFLAWFDLPEYTHEFENPKARDVFVETLNDEEKELRRVHSLTLEQLYWRRITIADLSGDVELFRQEMPATPEEAFIVSGVPIFDRRRLRTMAIACKKKEFGTPRFQGHTTSRGLVPDEFGELKMWAPALRGATYVMGVDVADGGEDGDYSCVEVFRALKAPYVAEQVAEWHGHLDPYNFAHVVERLGRMYNEALAAIETNAHGLATQQELQKTYWNLYQASHLDRYDSKLTTKLGWETSVRTKKLLISFATHCISDLNIVIRSSALVRECMTFVRDKNDSASAKGSGYDDRVMAMMIGLFALQQQNEPEGAPIETVSDVIIAPPNYIDKDFQYILEYGKDDSYEQTWENF